MVTMTLACRLLLGEADICIRRIDVDCRLGSGREELVMYHTDPGADIKYCCALQPLSL